MHQPDECPKVQRKRGESHRWRIVTDLPNAFSQPQHVRPGCQHQLGCRCVPPYWLRASTPAEQAREKWLREGPPRS